MTDYWRGNSGPCCICGTMLDWYHSVHKKAVWFNREAETGDDHWEQCPGAWNLHLRLAEIKS
jgi:hypothetical protein